MLKDELFENEPTALSYRRARAAPPRVMAAFRRIVEENQNRRMERGGTGHRDQSGKAE